MFGRPGRGVENLSGSMVKKLDMKPIKISTVTLRALQQRKVDIGAKSYNDVILGLLGLPIDLGARGAKPMDPQAKPIPLPTDVKRLVGIEMDPQQKPILKGFGDGSGAWYGVDPGGGPGEEKTIVVQGHMQDGTAVVDSIKEFKPEDLEEGLQRPDLIPERAEEPEEENDWGA